MLIKTRTILPIDGSSEPLEILSQGLNDVLVGEDTANSAGIRIAAKAGKTRPALRRIAEVASGTFANVKLSVLSRSGERSAPEGEPSQLTRIDKHKRV